MPKSKFEHIYRDLKEKIESEEYPYMELLPSENQLIEVYDCSRNTVRRAIKMLATEGYVQSQHGVGVRSLYRPIHRTNYLIGGIETFKDSAIRNNITTSTHVISFEDLISLLEFLTFPDTAGRIVRGAHDGCMDMVSLYLFLHILVVHAPYAVFVLFELASYEVIADSADFLKEAHVGGSMHKHVVTVRAKNFKSAYDSAQDAVLISDMLCFQTLDAVSLRLPVYDAVEVFLPRCKISESGMFRTLYYGVDYGGSGGKIHVGDPHGYDVKAFAYLSLGSDAVRVRSGINSDSVHSSSVEDACEIVFH